jgi:hypothetical protein
MRNFKIKAVRNVLNQTTATAPVATQGQITVVDLNMDLGGTTATSHAREPRRMAHGQQPRRMAHGRGPPSRA